MCGGELSCLYSTLHVQHAVSKASSGKTEAWRHANASQCPFDGQTPCCEQLAAMRCVLTLCHVSCAIHAEALYDANDGSRHLRYGLVWIRLLLRKVAV